MFTDLNLWAILVSGLVYWILGGIWYAAVFSKSWQEALGFNAMNAAEKSQLQKDFPKALLTHFISGLILRSKLAIPQPLTFRQPLAGDRLRAASPNFPSF